LNRHRNVRILSGPVFCHGGFIEFQGSLTLKWRIPLCLETEPCDMLRVFNALCPCRRPGIGAFACAFIVVNHSFTVDQVRHADKKAGQRKQNPHQSGAYECSNLRPFHRQHHGSDFHRQELRFQWPLLYPWCQDARLSIPMPRLQSDPIASQVFFPRYQAVEG